MALGLIIAGAVAVGSAVYSGYSASSTSKANAEAQRFAASVNADNVISTGYDNATLTGIAGEMNARNAEIAAQYSAESLTLVNGYNAALTRSITDYNVSLLEAELPALYEQWQLSDLQLRQQRARTEGAIIATQAASGTVIGEGSNADVIVDVGSQFALDAAVLRHNYDLASLDVLNAISRSEWEGEAAIQKMNWETEIGAWNTLAQGQLSSLGIRTQSLLSSTGTLLNAQSQADSLLSGGSAAYTSGINTANQQLTAGVVNGIGTAASMYAAGSSGGGTA